MKVEIYKSYGVLAHEKQPFYSQHAPASDIYDVITVDVPNAIGVNEMDDVLIELDGATYTLQEVLSNYGDAPALVWYDGEHNRHKLLKEV